MKKSLQPFLSYVIWNNQNRWGEFEFCCSTQANYCRSLEEAKKEIKGIAVEEKSDRKYFEIYRIKLTKVG